MASRAFSWLLLFGVGVIEFVVVAGGIAVTDLNVASFSTILKLAMAGYALAIVGMAVVASAVFR
jgi:CRISPR/Cas system-associated exonuclease Cas4 (RecB family)